MFDTGSLIWWTACLTAPLRQSHVQGSEQSQLDLSGGASLEAFPLPQDSTMPPNDLFRTPTGA